MDVHTTDDIEKILRTMKKTINKTMAVVVPRKHEVVIS